MADDVVVKDDDTQVNTDGDGDTVVGDHDDDTDADGDKAVDADSLKDADREVLLGVIEVLRDENANRRRQVKAIESEHETLGKRLKELEEASLTDAEREKDRLDALEAKASRADALAAYAEYVETELGAEMKRVEKLKADTRRPYTDLLSAFGEDDHLGRLRALRALRAAEGIRGDTVKEGDQGNPGKPDSSPGELSVAQKLAWSEQATREAKLSGMIPSD